MKLTAHDEDNPRNTASVTVDEAVVGPAAVEELTVQISDADADRIIDWFFENEDRDDSGALVAFRMELERMAVPCVGIEEDA